MFKLSVIVATVTLLVAGAARAQTSAPTVAVPLTIDYLTLSEALKRQMYTENGRAPLWNGSDPCQYLYAEHPSFSRQGNELKLESNGSLSIGVSVGSQCLSPISWQGIIETEVKPYISGHTLRFRVTDINLLNAQHEKTLIAGKGFDLVKQYFIPRFETFEFDLEPATRQLENLAQAASPPLVAERVKTSLASLRVLPELATLDDGVRATVQLTLPPTPAASPPSPPARLTPEELAAFEKQLDQWDAFLVFAIKQLGGVNNDPQFRAALLALLLDNRFRLVDALANPQNGGADPVRVLFLDTWNRLGQIIRAAASRNTLGDRSLEFLSFISAGDALLALDQAAPALGMRISADDLRRLAHLMAPQATGDPLAFSFDVDPTLQGMFGMKQPLQSQGPLEAAPTEVQTASPSPTPSVSAWPTSTAALVVPSSTPSPSAMVTPTPAPSARESGASTLEFPAWPSVSNVYAAEPPSAAVVDAARRLQELGKKLKRAVIRDDNADQYRAEVGQLLELTGRHEMNEQEVDPRYRGIYSNLVTAVAWQESCWRQFELKGNRVVYLESSSHDVGLMQVNKYVWRGFYSIPRLEWDILYNASAGMEILAQLLEDLGNKRSAMSPGKPNELARSTYAAYNGGPGAYRRWRGRESSYERLVDASFWAKYQAVSRGQTIDILSCAAEWARTPGH